MKRMTLLRPLALLALATAFAVPAEAQSFYYIPGQNMTARGEMELHTDVFGSFPATQAVNFVNSSTVGSPAFASITDSKNFAISSLGTLQTASCLDNGEAHIRDGSTVYSFVGQPNQMTFTVRTLRDHDHLIQRLSEMNTILPRSVESKEHLPKSAGKALVIEVPFAAVNNPSYISVAPNDFCMSRKDTGPTTGDSSLRWKLFLDVDLDGKVSAADTLVASSKIKLTAVPFNSTSKCNPGQFAPVARAQYVLELRYKTNSEMTTNSPGCPDFVTDFSNVDDDASWKMTIL